jgi:hypothetical protein
MQFSSICKGTDTVVDPIFIDLGTVCPQNALLFTALYANFFIYRNIGMFVACPK